MPHIPVMTTEVLEYLLWDYAGKYVDCTLGDGMHSKAILRIIGPHGGSILGLDRDPRALDSARSNLSNHINQVELALSTFGEMESKILDKKEKPYSGFLFDLGLNSSRLKNADDGFSYMIDGPLDMRMSPHDRLTAARIVNDFPEKQLADLLFRNSDERFSRKIAKAIAGYRQKNSIQTTYQLRDIIYGVVKGYQRLKSVARCFQALRIAVNNELEELKNGLPAAFMHLQSGGRLVVISYHSIEDRIVKGFLRDNRLPRRAAEGKYLKILTPKPVRPTADEQSVNPAARSARLRDAEMVIVSNG